MVNFLKINCRPDSNKRPGVKKLKKIINDQDEIGDHSKRRKRTTFWTVHQYICSINHTTTVHNDFFFTYTTIFSLKKRDNDNRNEFADESPSSLWNPPCSEKNRKKLNDQVLVNNQAEFFFKRIKRPVSNKAQPERFSS